MHFKTVRLLLGRNTDANAAGSNVQVILGEWLTLFSSQIFVYASAGAHAAGCRATHKERPKINHRDGDYELYFRLPAPIQM